MSGDLVIGTSQRRKVTVKGASGDVQVGILTRVPVWTDISSLSGAIHSKLQGRVSRSAALTTSPRPVTRDIVLNQF